MTEGTALLQLARLVAADLRGDERVRVKSVQHDSRHVGEGALFAALVGANVDGHNYVAQACERGATALMVERAVDAPLPQLIVKSTRRSLGPVASEVYGRPTESLRTVGVTGTNGKTTVAWLVEQILSALGHKPAVLGTLRAFAGEVPVASAHTTPEADDIARFACECRVRGDGALIMETSSHALAMHRVDGISFDVAAFTNLSQDHLDFHQTMEAYGKAKTRLFSELAPSRMVINLDDAFGRQLAERFSSAIGVSAQALAEADLFARSVSFQRGGFEATLQTPWGEHALEVPLVGLHNLENLLVALGIAHALDLALEPLFASGFFSSLRGAPGRMQRVEHPNDVLMYVDYAHTPDALARALAAARGVTGGKVWAVFGCGGDRDRTKRPLMAKAAEKSADVLVVTSDNPRSEEPNAIIEEICAGLTSKKRAHIEVDRRKAIRYAVRNAKPGDTIVVAGKGHEDYQIIGTTKYHLSDVEELHAAVQETFGSVDGGRA